MTAPDTEPAAGDIHLVRMLQLASPSLPVGGFSYSQGLEYAVACDWIRDADSFGNWLAGIAGESLAHLEVPVLARLTRAAAARDAGAFSWWVDFLIASRETRELRAEERSRGRAMRQVLAALAIDVDPGFADGVERCQLAGFVWAAGHWQVPVERLALAWAWSWLENSVTAGIKLIPLGQSAGQRLLAEFGATLPGRVARGLGVDDDQVGGSLPALAIASSLHETQYTRLFRS